MDLDTVLFEVSLSEGRTEWPDNFLDFMQMICKIEKLPLSVSPDGRHISIPMLQDEFHVITGWMELRFPKEPKF